MECCSCKRGRRGKKNDEKREEGEGGNSGILSLVQLLVYPLQTDVQQPAGVRNASPSRPTTIATRCTSPRIRGVGIQR